MNMPFVSVIIPTYNRLHTLKASVESVRKQTYSEMELIIVDDGSTDGTREWLKTLQNNDIHIILSEENRGAAHARNLGIKAAKGELIAFEDSDDIWMEQKLELQVEAFLAHPEIGLCYTKFFYDEPEFFEWPPKDIDETYTCGKIFPYLLQTNFVGGPTMMVSRDVICKVGMFEEELRCMEDYELTLRIAKYYPVWMVNQLLVKAGQTPGSLSKNIGAHVQATAAMIQMYREDFIQYGVLERKLSMLRDLASKILQPEKVEQIIQLLS